MFFTKKCTFEMTKNNITHVILTRLIVFKHEENDYVWHLTQVLPVYICSVLY